MSLGERLWDLGTGPTKTTPVGSDPSLLKYPRTVLASSWLIFGTIATCIFVIFVSLVEGRGPVGWIASRIWGLVVMATSGVRPFLIRGGDRLSSLDAAVLMANHRSHLDPPGLIAKSRRPINFVTKHTLFWVPVFGFAMRRMGHISINRSNKQKAFDSIDQAAQDIAGGRRVLVFPEGTRSPTEELGPFKKGGFVLAIKSGAPIIPIGIAGSGEILPKGWHWLGRGPVTLVVGEPIHTTCHTLDTKDALIAEVRAAILALRAEANAWRDTLIDRG